MRMGPLRAALSVAWAQNRVALGWLSLAVFLLTWLLGAPVAPMRDGILRLVADTPFLQKLVGGVMGLDLTGEMTVKLLVGSTWGHPFLLAAIWGFAMLGGSRFPAHEIDEGYLDTLMCHPLPRTTALAAHAMVTLGGLLWLLAVALLGFGPGCRGLGSDAPSTGEMLPVALGLWASAVFVLGLTALVAAGAAERGRVVGLLLGFLLLGLLLAYLKPFLPWAARFSALSLLHYYRPGDILQSGQWPWSAVNGLVGAGALLWGLAAWRLSRRDL